jgi:CheY-like chemotaxis protein
MSWVISPYSQSPGRLRSLLLHEIFPNLQDYGDSSCKYEICMYKHIGNVIFGGRLNPMTRILLVDDENLILYSLSAALRHDGSSVTTATNGKEALSEIRRSSYDICFLDIHLPDANGFDLMKIMREIAPATRIILMTAVDLDDVQMNDLRRNDGLYLPKPFDLEEVRSIVKSIQTASAATVRDV